MAGRVLITGATGFIGRRLSADLREAGYPLSLAVRRPAEASDDRVRIVPVGAIGAGTDWSDALAGIQTVIHAAARVHVAPERARAEAELFDEVNRAGSVRLFEAAASRGVALFVFISSITVLGSATRPGAPFTERSPLRPETPYAASKAAAERELVACAERHPATRLVILRPPLCCGPGVGGNLRALLRLAATPLPLPLGGIANRRTLLSLANLSAAIEAVLRASGLRAGDPAPRPATYVLGDPEPLSTTAMVEALREGLGRNARLFPVPSALAARALRLIGQGGAYGRLFGDLEVDASAFARDFGWQAALDSRTALVETGRAYRAARAGP